MIIAVMRVWGLVIELFCLRVHRTYHLYHQAKPPLLLIATHPPSSPLSGQSGHKRLGQWHTELLGDQLPLHISHDARVSLACGHIATLSQQSDAHNVHTGRVVKSAAHRKDAVHVTEVDETGSRLLNGIALVQVQSTLCLALEIRCDDEDKVLLAQFSGCVGRVLAEGQDTAATDVSCDFGKVDVVTGKPVASSADGLVGEVVVEDVIGEVEGDACTVVIYHRTDQDTVTPEELMLDGERGGVFGVDEE
jgi:hypothetical protein